MRYFFYIDGVAPRGKGKGKVAGAVTKRAREGKGSDVFFC